MARGPVVPASEILPILIAHLSLSTTFEQFHAVVPEFDLDFRILLAQLLYFCQSGYADKLQVQVAVAQHDTLMTHDRFISLVTSMFALVHPSLKAPLPTIKALVAFTFRVMWNRDAPWFMRHVTTHPPFAALTAPPSPADATGGLSMTDCLECFQCLPIIADAALFEVLVPEKRPLQFYRSRDVSEISPALLAKLSLRSGHRRTETVQCGWLVKAGGKKADKSWLKRYFVLTTSELSYFEDEEATKAKGVVPVPSMQRAVHLAEDRAPRRNPLTLQLVTTSRTYFLEAECEKDLKDWHGALCQVIRSRTS